MCKINNTKIHYLFLLARSLLFWRLVTLYFFSRAQFKIVLRASATPFRLDVIFGVVVIFIIEKDFIDRSYLPR